MGGKIHLLFQRNEGTPRHSGRISYCILHRLVINAEEDIINISGTNTMDGFKIKLVLLTRINKKLITACYLKYNTVYVKGAKTQ